MYSDISTCSDSPSDLPAHNKWSNLDEVEISPLNLSGDEGQPRDTSISEGKKATFVGTVLNIINTTVGGGILGMPYVMRKLGLGLGVTALVVGGLLMYLCSFVLQKTKNLSGRSNYVTIAEHCFKSRGSKFLSLILIINNLGACVIGLTIFSTVARNILSVFNSACALSGTPDVPAICSNAALVTIGGLIVLPFCFIRTFGNMAIVSVSKIIAIIIFTSITIGCCIVSIMAGTNASDVSFTPASNDPIQNLGCIAEVVLAYNFLYNQFSIYKSMRGGSDAKIGDATKVGMGIVMLVYVTIGVSGYVIFGGLTDNVLKNFTQGQLGTFCFLCLNIAFLISSLMSYPATYFSPRNIIYKALLDWNREKNASKNSLGQEEFMLLRDQVPVNHRHERKIYICVVLGTNALVVILGILVPGLNEMMGLIGAVATDSLVFLFPTAFYLALAPRGAKHRPLAIVLAVVGVMIGITGFISSMMNIF